MSTVSVIIVNYKSAGLTLSCIKSIWKLHQDKYEIDIHVIDNNSGKLDMEIIEYAANNSRMRITIHAEDVNHGFGGAINIVVDRIVKNYSPDYVFLINPDACLKNDAITILRDFLDRHPRAAAAGARIYAPDSEPRCAAFRFPSVIGTFESTLSSWRVTQMLGNWEAALPPIIPTQPVDWVSGAAVMLRLSSVQRAGLFDPTYFLYFEEVDLMKQLSLQGEETWHVAEASVTHIEGASTGVTDGPVAAKRLPIYWYESWRRYFMKNHGRGIALMAAVAWYAGAIGNNLVAVLKGRRATVPHMFYRDFWRIGLRPLLGLRPLPHDL